ncbi:UxaA family hydrolase [Lutispora saccharofermentans]|uniref:UxaA family hydrolase n=1 Tax=Lutispora saccharofermentans TaxID=3024236 RepID=A0ABT1NHP2_9FIRM|nr:UxaA family hydrolase [Lutispora saccharofermentans]MCQ1530770.1 UxaA family hydrolase [Lutispora saccharofermentans]
MKANSIMLNSKDNVVTVTCEIKKGQTIAYFKDENMHTITAADDIPIWNKAAVAPIAHKEAVIKYGEIIGAATKNIVAGAFVSHLNIMSLPRDYATEMK